MNPGLIAMMLGAFAVPAVLLWAGHRMRRRSARWQSAFWGGLAGHLVSLVVACVAALIPAEVWQSTDVVRGAAGFWSLLVCPAAGAIGGALRPRSQ